MATDKTWLDDSGRPKPLEECTKEQLIDRFKYVVAVHSEQMADKNAAHSGAISALEARLKDHRKARRLANNRADKAVKAMQDMLETFKNGE